MFIDEAKVEVKAGKGGDGIVSFRRERFVHKGGPDGGDGGNGGSLWVAISERMTTLTDYRRQKLYKAEDGQNGGKNEKKGKKGEDLVLYFPRGTVIKIKNKKLQKKDDSGVKEIINRIDLVNYSDKIEIARGGRGGHGNAWFKSSTRQAPRLKQPGKMGEEKILEIELKLLANVGLIGMPNAGKSTLLSRISHARPKISDYPFTTVKPNLGVIDFRMLKIKDAPKDSIVVADIPGLIEGAHQGKGLGDRFLRHIERCKVLVHVIDGASCDVARDYRVINTELKNYSPKLAEKKQIIVLNKTDALTDKIKNQELKELSRAANSKVLPISAVTGEGVRELLLKLL